MYNREQMKEALGKLSWNTMVTLLEGTTSPDPDVYDRLVEDVVRTGCLIKKHATPNQRKTRDKFRAKLRALIVEKSTTELVDYFDAHILECERIEEAFLTILASVAECDISKRPLHEQVWAVVDRTVAEIALIHEKLGEAVTRLRYHVVCAPDRTIAEETPSDVWLVRGRPFF